MTKPSEASESYAAANAIYSHRTGSDWMQLTTATCPGGFAHRTPWGDADRNCGQRFKVEVAGQTHCRDCHANQHTGFYAQEAK